MGRTIGREGRAWLALAMLSWVGAGCVDEAAPFDRTALAQLRVSIVDASGLGDSPFVFATEFVPLAITVEALDFDGNRIDYDGQVVASMVPGQVTFDSSIVSLVDGLAESHVLELRYAFGQARIWVEEIGFELDSLQCSDGFDNDGDGLLDYPGDRGCRDPLDPSEGTATYVTGLSDALSFSPLTIRDVQFNPNLVGESVLLGREVRIELGTLIVTNVIDTGFYVTDVDDTAYNGMFVFNFSFPEGVSVGDKLSWFSGGVAEFQGDTQVTFPAWAHDASYTLEDATRQELASCQPVTDASVLTVEPAVLSSTDLGDLASLEGEESNLVRVTNALVSTRFVNCDFDFNADIDGPAEEACRNECQANNLCTELSSFVEFGQFKVEVGGASAEIANAAQVAGFDPLEGCDVVVENPLEYACPERTLASATGVLRHIFLTTRIQLWVLLPRFACDLVFACESNVDCVLGGACNSQNLCEQEP